MKTHIENFPQDIVDAFQIIEINQLKKFYPNFNNILICGMGASGIGGLLVSRWFQNELVIPVNCCQDYNLPGYVNKSTLVIACSYSGNTEETLSAVEQAHEKGASIIAITSGGKLERFCSENNYESTIIPGGKPPRTQLAYMCVLLTDIFCLFGFIEEDRLVEIFNASSILRGVNEKIHKEAKRIAESLFKKNIVIYSELKDEAIAVRARQQFQENSKVLCSHHVIPEMNHNELVGWAGGNEKHAVIFIETASMHPQNKKRFDYTRGVVESKTAHSLTIKSDFENEIVSSLYLIHVLDWASYYLAELRDVDATEVDVIDKLKISLV
jgi:glucose/mannose-6-phosphate isomerase|tara:strand:+ start:1928 stop:2905 length:978 start_codon:yes stop_codon:yes gene_type:complete